jgi:glycine cleavage system H lipoate-binding protein
MEPLLPVVLIFSHECYFQFAPVSGDVVDINEELGGQPSLLNKSPEDKGELHPSSRTSAAAHSTLGWLFQLKLSKPKEVRSGFNLAGLRLCPALTYLIA